MFWPRGQRHGACPLCVKPGSGWHNPWVVQFRDTAFPTSIHERWTRAPFVLSDWLLGLGMIGTGCLRSDLVFDLVGLEISHPRSTAIEYNRRMAGRLLCPLP